MIRKKRGRRERERDGDDKIEENFNHNFKYMDCDTFKIFNVRGTKINSRSNYLKKSDCLTYYPRKRVAFMYHGWVTAVNVLTR